jgi:glycine oxidase ThiO
VPQSFDALIIGAGIIGLTLALELRDTGMSVAVLERNQPGREATWASAGMLSRPDHHTPEELHEMAEWSCDLYPAFVRHLTEITGEDCSYDNSGAFFVSPERLPAWDEFEVSRPEIGNIEPQLAATAGHIYRLRDASVDPRVLTQVLLSACRKRAVEVHHQHPVTELISNGQAIVGVHTPAGEFHAPIVINCAGAWTSELSRIPVEPVKGQIFAVVPSRPCLKHIVRSDDIYIVPRRDGRIVIGATVERVGYDKRVLPDVIQLMHQHAARLVPELGEARIADAWAGLRPAAPDELPVMGASQILAGYFISTGHFRNGVLLAPANAKLVTQLILGSALDLDIGAFSPARFA